VTTLSILPDDLSSPDVQALIVAHLDGMHATSPAESVHALDLGALRHPSISFFAARVDGELAGIGALRTIDHVSGELKSMRVAPAFLGRGIGRALLQHLIAESRSRGFSSLWLETGSTPDFLPAVRLYESEGFAVTGPFGDYREDPFSIFMTRTL